MLVGSSILIIAVLISAVPFINKRNEIPEKHLEVVLRDLGHQLLLTAKDSTSRVLPVRKLNSTTYQISFQNDIGFISDTLINLVQRTFEKNALADDYIVSLRSCKQNETVLAFEKNGETGDLAPCRGRKLEVGCYSIEIDLLKKNKFNFFWLLPLVIPLSFIGWYVKGKFRKKGEATSVTGNSDYIQLGNFRFYSTDHVLKIEDRMITL